MKKLIALLALLPILATAQKPFGQNPTWHFTFSEFGYTGLKKVAYAKDTLMHGMTWQKFDVTGIREIQTGPNPNDISQDTNAMWGPIFLASKNDSVFRLTQDSIYLLYDFNADVGDTWQYDEVDTTRACLDTPIATVMQTGTDTIGGLSVEYYELSFPEDTFSFNGGSPQVAVSAASYLSNRIYPQFGSLNYNGLFNVIPNLCDGSSFQLSEHTLRCFSNDSISFNRTDKGCDDWSLLSEEELTPSSFVIFPNPSNKRFTISTTHPSGERLSYEIIDLHGQFIEKGSLSNAGMAVLEIESPGVYIVRISSKRSGSVSTQRLIVK